MSFIKMFRATKADDSDRERVKTCVNNIKTAVSGKSSITDFINQGDYSVAFSGSEDALELLLELSIQKYGSKKYLYASLDDGITWQEWDYENQSEFEKDIAVYIANRVNRTVKTVTEKEKHKSYRQSVYYLNENTNEWVLLEDDFTEDKLFCMIVANKTETEEVIKTYKIESR